MVERRRVDPVWIERILEKPARTEPDPEDPQLTHAIGPITENDNRLLRVIYNDTVVPPMVVTVFFDRRLKG